MTGSGNQTQTFWSKDDSDNIVGSTEPNMKAVWIPLPVFAFSHRVLFQLIFK